MWSADGQILVLNAVSAGANTASFNSFRDAAVQVADGSLGKSEWARLSWTLLAAALIDMVLQLLPMQASGMLADHHRQPLEPHDEVCSLQITRFSVLSKTTW